MIRYFFRLSIDKCLSLKPSSSTTCTVTFNTGDSAVKVDPQTIEKGSKVTRPETDPTLADKAFIGWVLRDEAEVAFDFDTPITKDTTIYAKWKDATAGLSYGYNDGYKKALTVEKGEETSLSGVVYIPAKATHKDDGNNDVVDNVVEIKGTKSNGFKECAEITTIYIPQSVTTIANYAFNECTKLTEIYYGGTKEKFKEILAGSYYAPVKNQDITVYCRDGQMTWDSEKK